MFKIVTTLVTLPALFAFSACSNSNAKDATPAPITLRSNPMEVVEAAETGAKLRLYANAEGLKVEQTLRLLSVSYVINAQGQSPQTGEVEVDEVLSASRNPMISVDVPIRWQDDNLRYRSPQDAETITLSVDTKMSFSNGAQNFIIDKSFGGEWVAPRQVEAKLKPLAARTSKTVELSITAELENKNPFVVKLEDVRYRIEIDKVSVLEGELGRSIKLSRAATAEYDLYTMLGENEHIELAKTIISNGRFNYRAFFSAKRGDETWEQVLDGEVEFPEKQ